MSNRRTNQKSERYRNVDGRVKEANNSIECWVTGKNEGCFASDQES